MILDKKYETKISMTLAEIYNCDYNNTPEEKKVIGFDK